MRQLNWEEIKNLADRKSTLLTKTRVPFQVVAASEETLTVRVRSGEEHTIGRTNLEKAVQKVQAGAILNGPKDYRHQIADDRPAYAWAILRELRFFKIKSDSPWALISLFLSAFQRRLGHSTSDRGHQALRYRSSLL